MKSKLFAAFFIALTFCATPTAARETVAIINYDNLVVATSSGKPLDDEKVKQAILAAAGALNWSVAYQADGKLLATLSMRGKHTVTVEIAYAADKYSLHYKGSTNMKFGERDGQPAIHPFYNKWTQALKEAIRIELLKL